MQRQFVIGSALGLVIWGIVVSALCSQTSCSTAPFDYLQSALGFMAVTAAITIAFKFRLKTLLFGLRIHDFLLAPIIFLVVASLAVSKARLWEIGHPWVYVLAFASISCFAFFLSRKINRNSFGWISWAIAILLTCAFSSVLLGGMVFVWVLYVSVANLCASLSVWWCISLLRDLAPDD